MKEMNSKVSNYLVKISNNQIREANDKKEFYAVKKLRDLSMQELKKIYWAEKELAIVIPMLIRNATTFELVETLTVHLNYTKERIKRLEEIFPMISEIKS
jgi:ferritin-like metal-binding protein YciE